MLLRCQRGARFPGVRGRRLFLLPILAAAVLLAASPEQAPVTAKPSPAADSAPYGGMAVAKDIRERLRQYPKTKIDFDRSLLAPEENRVLLKLIDASRILDSIFSNQVSEENPAVRVAILKTVNTDRAAALDVFRYFSINKGPWDRLKGDEPFLGAKPKPPGAAFYPPDMTKEEFEKWIAAHPEDKAAFEGLF